jgi:ABC-type uncharacterized transport system auxiliary subunit
MIAQYLAERIRSRSLFTSVWGNESRAAADFVLNGTIERLEEVDEGRGVAVVCSISARLSETRTGSVVWSRTTTERVPVEQRDVAGVVNGLTAAVRTNVDRLVADLELELTEARHP